MVVIIYIAAVCFKFKEKIKRLMAKEESREDFLK